MAEIPDELVVSLRAAQRVAVLTGAGVSQESGLRTFRDAQAGLWAQYRPEDLASPDAFARNPQLVWDWYAMRRTNIGSVTPNPGHYALVTMERMIPDFQLITQNVDGLHQAAGSTNVLELHGNIRQVRCSECSQLVNSWEEQNKNVPVCAICGGLLRPNVVWFGESLPRAALETAIEASRTCDIFFSIGTSGVVQPAASLAIAARNRGAIVVEINLENTPLAPRANFRLYGRSGEILPQMVHAVWG